MRLPVNDKFGCSASEKSQNPVIFFGYIYGPLNLLGYNHTCTVLCPILAEGLPLISTKYAAPLPVVEEEKTVEKCKCLLK